MRVFAYSATAKYVAMEFALFRGLGAVKSLWSVSPTFEAYSQLLALGALMLHGLPAPGFIAVALRTKTEHRAFA